MKTFYSGDDLKNVPFFLLDFEPRKMTLKCRVALKGGGVSTYSFCRNGNGKKYKFIKLKEKCVVVSPAGKNRIDFNFFLWTCRKRTRKTFVSQSD